MPDEAEYQPYNSVFQPQLLPDQVSSITLSGGRTIPHTFYLGPNNTVPFVSLESPSSAKEISWGEVITLQPGTNVKVRSCSYMPGDLQIQSGTVPGPHPARITTPIRLNRQVQSNVYVFQTEFTCDTRGARRAWLSIDWANFTITFDGNFPARTIMCKASITGYMRQHSNTPQLPHIEYAYRYERFTDNPVDECIFALGRSENGNAMLLADYATIRLEVGPSRGDLINFTDINLNVASYVLEY